MSAPSDTLLPLENQPADASILQQRPSINWRSVLAGLVGIIGICTLTPYNDYALNNGAMVGNNLPIGAMLYMFILCVAVNGPLNKYVPRWALSTGELVV